MRRLLTLLLALLVLTLCACEQAKPPEPPARPEPATRAQPAVQIEQAAFGVFNRTADGRVDFKPTKTVPLIPNQEFGWVIGVTTTKPTVRWREEFTVPAAPETWGPVEGKHEISADRRVSILEREVPVEGNFLFNAWTISPGDPKGRHTMKVTVEDAPPIVFEFDIE
jgi:hypothetical protein